MPGVTGMLVLAGFKLGGREISEAPLEGGCGLVGLLGLLSGGPVANLTLPTGFGSGFCVMVRR